MPSIVARWRDWSGDGIEHLVLQDDDDGVRVDSVVIGDADGERFGTRYRIACDREWRTRSVEVRIVGDGRIIELSSDGTGNWRDGSDNTLQSLDGAMDVDITCTPFTNTLPIRRLGLEAGQSAEIVTAYVEAPGLALTAEPQRYTCLESMRRYPVRVARR